MKTKILILIKQHPLIAFIVMAYAISWILWLVASNIDSLSNFLTWIGGFGPAIAAIILTPLLDGREGLRDLLSKAFRWRFHPLLYIAALGIPILGTVLLMILYAVITSDFAPLQSLGNWLQGLLRSSFMLILTLIFGIVIVAGEEFGWRGFALPKLRTKHGDLAASILVGLMWGLWHLPNLWPFNPKHEVQDLLFFMADIIVISVLYTWLYINSNESILLVSLFHSAYDLMVMYASASLPFLRKAHGYELLVVLVFAALIVSIYGPKRFRFSPKNTDNKSDGITPVQPAGGQL